MTEIRLGVRRLRRSGRTAVVVVDPAIPCDVCGVATGETGFVVRRRRGPAGYVSTRACVAICEPLDEERPETAASRAAGGSVRVRSVPRLGVCEDCAHPRMSARRRYRIDPRTFEILDEGSRVVCDPCALRAGLVDRRTRR